MVRNLRIQNLSNIFDAVGRTLTGLEIPLEVLTSFLKREATSNNPDDASGKMGFSIELSNMNEKGGERRSDSIFNIFGIGVDLDGA